ncbi:MAG: hypothetical protein HRT64_02555 [Erythrobacter sp.]|nr:hypothetical protein [Erythrobacter sp.]
MIANFTLIAVLAGVSLAASQGAQAQPPSDKPDQERVIIDILAPPPPEESAELAYEECLAEQDAARIRGEIVVCRKLPDGAELSGFDKEQWERGYAERTQGDKNPNLDGLANGPVYRTDGSVFMVTVKRKVGDPPPPPLIIDVEAIPEAPPGSDADRVGKGMDPEEGP